MENEVRTMLIDQAARLLDAEVPPGRLKALLEVPGSFDAPLWSKAVEQGWPGLAVAEDTGGLGIDLGTLAALLQELGARTISLPLVQGHVAAAALREAGHGDAAEKLVSGEAIATLALGEADDCGLMPKASIVNGRLTGAKAPASFAAVATHALVGAISGSQPGLYWVDVAAEGVRREVVPTIDNARSAACLHFDNAPAIPLGGGKAAVLQIAAMAATLAAFEQVGGAQRCLDISVGYARERKVFGQPIGAFQAIKHKLADMYQELEIGRGCAIDALEALAEGRDDFLMLACTARLGAGAAYDFAARECIQTHGGIGVTWEAEPQHHYRRARALSLEIGGAPFWRDLLVDGQSVLEVA